MESVPPGMLKYDLATKHRVIHRGAMAAISQGLSKATSLEKEGKRMHPGRDASQSGKKLGQD
jgi:hypothetical protein